MKASTRHRFLLALPFTLLLLLLTSIPATAGDYITLDGVTALKTVFDYGKGSPREATVIFPAIRDTYTNEAVTSLPHKPITAIVFHAEAVKLVSTARGEDAEENKALDKVAEMIKQFKKDGVRMAVCMYAVKVVGVDPSTLMPEIDRVPNGFVSVAGYQGQGFSVISVP